MPRNKPRRPDDMGEVVGWVYDYWASKRCRNNPPGIGRINLQEISRMNPLVLPHLSFVPIQQTDTGAGLFGEPREPFVEVCKSGHLWHRKGWAETPRDGETALRETLALPVLGEDQTIECLVMVTADLPTNESKADTSDCFVRWLSYAPARC